MARRARFVVGLCAAVAVAGTLPAGAAPGRPAAGKRPPGLRADFVSPCRYSHSAPDDPIVKPNQPGASHQHDFFANKTTNAASTDASLRAGATTCRRPLDTAAYWAPALLDGAKVVQPTNVAAYYLTGGKEPSTIKAFPAGLRIVAGPGAGTAQWACRTAGKDVARSMTAPPSCAGAAELVVRIFFPDCWDGLNLDSADHRSHMARSDRGQCPATHPVPAPLLRLGFHYPGVQGGADVTLASGAPDSAHADFFNTWDQAELERLVRTCINAGVRCGGPGGPKRGGTPV